MDSRTHLSLVPSNVVPFPQRRVPVSVLRRSVNAALERATLRRQGVTFLHDTPQRVSLEADLLRLMERSSGPPIPPSGGRNGPRALSPVREAEPFDPDPLGAA